MNQEHPPQQPLSPAQQDYSNRVMETDQKLTAVSQKIDEMINGLSERHAALQNATRITPPTDPYT